MHVVVVGQLEAEKYPLPLESGVTRDGIAKLQVPAFKVATEKTARPFPSEPVATHVVEVGQEIAFR